ncbi:MAG: hypothetical protein M3R62_13460 [Acidobacteriota bacterium]|nr:hypothetical protein [Acidobacteriota bacterium]
MRWSVLGLLIVSPAIFARTGQTAPPAPPASAATDAAARAVVQRGIDYAGGSAAWASKKSVEFKKTVTRFKPDGSVEWRRVETHRYRLQPSFGGRIERDEAGKKALMVNNGTQAWRFVDSQELTSQAENNSARGSTFGSHYVFGMPFKLLDPGVHLAYAGKEKLAGGAEVEKIRATYDKGAGDAGGYHTWTYYFDTKTGRLTANHLNYDSGRYDFTEYSDDKTFSGVRLATHRRGFNADAKGKTGPQTTDTIYEDVRFDVPVSNSMFVPPRP